MTAPPRVMHHASCACGFPRGDTIEEDHQRNRALIAYYIMDKTGAIAMEHQRNGKTYVSGEGLQQNAHQEWGMLLAELMRIKAEGDYDAIKLIRSIRDISI